MGNLDGVQAKIAPVLAGEGVTLKGINQSPSGETFSIDLETIPGLDPKQVEETLRGIHAKLEEVIGDGLFYVRSIPKGSDSYVTV